jgi:hypothetical protein
MAVTTPSPRRFSAGWLLPAALATAAVATIVGVVVLSQHVGNDNVPARPPAFSYSPPATGVTRMSVRQAGNGTLTAVEDAPKGAAAPNPREITAAASTIVEVLKPSTSAAIQPGDWVTVIGIPNDVRNFSIHAVLDIPGVTRAGADGVGRSAGGFGGDEASPNADDRVILGGAVQQVQGDSLTLKGPAGPITVLLTASAPVYRLEAGTLGDIHEGDRIAVKGTDPNAPTSLLAQPAPAP